MFNYNTDNYSEVLVDFDTYDFYDPATWTLTGQYAPSSGHPSFTEGPYYFNTNQNMGASAFFYGSGGSYTVSVNQPGICNGSVQFYVAGSQIPDETITQELIALYNSLGGTMVATPNLMTGIAMKESSYMQFYSQTLYGQTMLWPYTSPGGKHVGLMMMSTTLIDAWAWAVTCMDGTMFFVGEKANITRSVVNRDYASHPGLPKLSTLMFENMVLLNYGMYPGGTKPNLQYYVPTCVSGSGPRCMGGSWQWMVTTDNLNGVSYVAGVRAELQS